MDFIPADTAAFFIQLTRYKNEYMTKASPYNNLFRLLFDLKRLEALTETETYFTIPQLLRDLKMSVSKENKLRMWDYLILFQGLDLIRFEVKEIKRGDIVEKKLRLTYLNDAFNRKMELMQEELKLKEGMDNFIEKGRNLINFDMSDLEF